MTAWIYGYNERLLIQRISIQIICFCEGFYLENITAPLSFDELMVDIFVSFLYHNQQETPNVYCLF